MDSQEVQCAGNALELYSGSVGFEARPVYRPSSLRFTLLSLGPYTQTLE
jgi:hypothetical protein